MTDLRPLNGQKVTLAADVEAGQTFILTNGRLVRTSDDTGDIGQQFLAITGSQTQDELIFIDQQTEPELIEDRSLEGKENIYKYIGIKFHIDSDDTTIPPTLAKDKFGLPHNIGDEVKIVIAAEWFLAILDGFEAGSVITLPYDAGEDIAIRRSISKDSGEWWKFVAGKISFVGISTESMDIGDPYSIATFGALVPGFSGLTDNGIVYSDYVLAPTLASTVALAGTGAGNVDDGDHDWKFTFEVTDVEGTYETDAGVATGSATVADKSVDGKISHTGIPVSANANTVNVKAYRRFNATGDYKLSYTVSNGTTVFEEDVANSALGAVIPTANTATGLITQTVSTTALTIGRADGTTAIRINDVPATVSVFNQDDFGTFDNIDSSRTMGHDSSEQGTGTKTILGSKAPIDTRWRVDDDTGAEEFFASKVYAQSVGGGTGSTHAERICSEALTKGNAVYIDRPAIFSDATSTTRVGYSVAQEKVAFSFVGSGVSTNQLNLALKKTGTPTDNLVIRIETDDAGEPSGTLIHVDAHEEIAGAGLTTDLVDTICTFAGSFTPAANTKYWIVLERSGPNDTGHYFWVGGEGAAWSFYSTWQYISGVWTEDVDRKAYIGSFTGKVDEIVTKTDSDHENEANFEGLANANVAEFQLVKLDVRGVSDTQTGLIRDTFYFLSGTPGEITTTPTGYGVGMALSDTALSIRHKFGEGAINRLRANIANDATEQSTTGSTVMTLVNWVTETNSTFPGFGLYLPQEANSRIVVNRTGRYKVSFTALAKVTDLGPNIVEIYNGATPTNIQNQTSSATYVSLSAEGEIELTKGNILYLKFNSASTDIATVKNQTLFVELVGLS